jgi:hypothetical protein
MGIMKQIHLEAVDAFDKYELETCGRSGQLSEELRNMFIDGYVQRIFDEIKDANLKRETAK